MKERQAKNQPVRAGRSRSSNRSTDLEGRWSALFEPLKIPTLLTSEGGTVARVNKAFEKLSGFARRAIEGKKTWMCFLGGDGPLFSIADLPDIPNQYECQLYDKSGKRKTVLLSATLVPGSGEKRLMTFVDITVYTKAEASPNRNDTAERSLFTQFAVDRARDAAMWMDEKGRFIYVNHAACHGTGYSREELLSMSVFDIDPYLSREQWSKNWVERRTRGFTFFEACHRAKDGRIYPVEVSSSHLSYHNREYSCAFVRDLTERKEAEKALKESERRYRELADLLPQTVFEMDRRGRITFLNQHALEAYGGTKEELERGINVLDVVLDEDRARIIRNLKQVLSGEPSRGNECLIRGRDGKPVPSMVYANPVMVDNECVGLRGIAIDISEQKRVERALRESEERFHQLFEQNEDALIIFQRSPLRILDANPAATKLFGYQKDVLIEHGPSLFFGEPELARFENLVSRSQDGQSFTSEDITGVTKAGNTVRMDVRGTVVKLRDTEVLRCSLRDITERLRLKEEKALFHAKLIHTNKMTSLGLLVSSVAHEVNNPNNFIIFNASLLGDVWQDALKVLEEYYSENGDFSLGGLPYSEMKEVVAKLLNGISEGSRRIKGIVENLKDFARNDHAGMEEGVDMNRVVSNSVSMLASQIKKHTKSFHLALGQDLPTVKGNFQQLEQVIINLIMNGLQALPGKDRGIEVATSLDRSGNYLVASVSDEGVGISKEAVGRAVEPFFTTKLASGGTGLGLSICNSIVKEHQGLLQIESEPGNGTRVFVKLPLRRTPWGDRV
jgi:PAS domain S-box-containing protein